MTFVLSINYEHAAQGNESVQKCRQEWANEQNKVTFYGSVPISLLADQIKSVV
jgi:hypothetical protein